MGWLLLVLLGAGVSAARAQGVDEPTVSRGQGAEACPDVPALRAQIAAIGGLADAFSRSGYAVEFAHTAARGGTFSARIRIREGTGERLIEAQAGSCAPLARATAVTLALLLDNEARRTPRPVPDSAASAPAPDDGATAAAPTKTPPTDVDRPRADDPNTAPVRARRAPRIDAAALQVGAAGVFGVVRTLTPALRGLVSLERGRFQYAVGALWAVPHTREFSPGTVDAKLASALVRLCARAVAVRGLRLSACSGAYAGVLTVEAHGFTNDRTRHEAWLAIPLELTLAELWSPVGLSLTTGMLLPVRRHDFSIDGLGKVFRSWPVAALLALSLELGWRSSQQRAGSQDSGP